MPNTDPPRPTARLRQLLGPINGAMLVLAIAVGAGIFSVPQQVAIYQSSPLAVLALWLGIGLLSTAAALVWAELGARLPTSGADFRAVVVSYGRHVGFLYSWKSFFLSSPSNRAALAVVAAEYLAVLAPAIRDHRLVVAIFVIVLCGAVNYPGLGFTSTFISWISIAKVVALLGFVALGLTYSSQALGGWSTTTPSPSELPLIARFGLSGVLIFFAYIGWNRLALVAEEFKRPERDIAPAVLLSMAVIIVLYLTVNATYLWVLGMDGVRASATVGADSVELLLGSSGAKVFAVIIIIAVFSGMSGSTMTSARLYYAMAKEGTFYRYFQFIHPKYHVPTRGVVVQVVTSIVLLMLRRNFVDLVTSAIFLNLIFYILRAQSLFTLRRRGIGAPGGYRVPFYPWLPLLVLAGLYSLLLVRLVFDWERAWFDLMLLGAGIPMSMLWFRWQDRQHRPSLTTSLD